MEIKNFSFMRFGLSAVLLMFMFGCQSTPRTEKRGPFDRGQVPQKDQSTSETDLEEIKRGTKRVGVVLGPGGAKAFAHVGVLKAFQQERIPIHKVIGLEWGALVGGLYSLNGQVHEVEWKLYKMEQEDLPIPKGLFGRKLGDEGVKIMNSFLKDSFAGADIRNSKVEFNCPSRSLWTGVLAWQDRGDFTGAISRCLSFPPIFKPQGTYISGASQASEAIERLAKEGYNVIILVNVLGSGLPVAQSQLKDHAQSVILWQEVRRAIKEAERMGIEMVEVDTSSYAIVDFKAKKSLVSLGERVGRSAARDLISKYGF